MYVRLCVYVCNTCMYVCMYSGGSRRGQIRPWPPTIEVGNGVWPPRGRKSNDSIVNLPKSNDFGPPRITVGYGFGPPMEKYHIKTLKKSMTKKVIRNFWR